MEIGNRDELGSADDCDEWVICLVTRLESLAPNAFSGVMSDCADVDTLFLWFSAIFFLHGLSKPWFVAH